MSDWMSRAKEVTPQQASNDDWMSRAKELNAASGLPIENEASPVVSTIDRLKMALSTDKNAQLDYLRKEYPGTKFELSPDREIMAYNDGDKAMRPVDPSLISMPSSYSEFAKRMAMNPAMGPLAAITNQAALNDRKKLATLLPDSILGLIQGAATTGGGALGTLAAGPGIGTIAGASAAGGGAGYLLNKGKRALAHLTGINDADNETADRVAGVVGAATPIAFGAGETPGLVQRAGSVLKNDIYPPIAEFFGGTPSQATKNYMKHTEFINDPENKNIYPFLADSYENFSNGMSKRQTELGKAVENAVTAIDSPVNISNAKAAFNNRIETLSKKPNLSNAEQSEIQSLRDIYKKQFGLSGLDDYMPDVVTPARAFDLQKNLKTEADFGANLTPETFAVKDTARASSRAINDELKGASDAVKAAKANYEEFTGMRNSLSSLENSPQSYYNNVTNLGSNSKIEKSGLLRDLAEKYGIDLTEPAEKLSAYKYFGNPGYNALSSGGTTSTSRSMMAGDIGEKAGAGIAELAHSPGPVAQVGKIIGKLGGNLIASPKAVKSQVNLMDALADIYGKNQALTPYEVPFVYQYNRDR